MRENEFTVNVKSLEDGPVTLHVHCSPETLDLVDPEYTFDRITGEIEFLRALPRVVTRGTLTTEATTQCVRCLTEALIQVSAPVQAIYENEKSIRETRNEIVSPEEQIVTPFNGDWIQPEEELREAILLELPTLPVCSPDCKGLCPQCGVNLNNAQCNCNEKDMDVSPWKSALKDLKDLKLE
jgi:uncharacterized protein